MWIRLDPDSDSDPHHWYSIYTCLGGYAGKGELNQRPEVPLDQNMSFHFQRLLEHVERGHVGRVEQDEGHEAGFVVG